MNTIRECVHAVRQWWKNLTGPLEHRLLVEANADIADPEWWMRKPTALVVHPKRSIPWSTKMQAVCELMDDEQIRERQQKIMASWSLTQHSESDVVRNAWETQ